MPGCIPVPLPTGERPVWYDLYGTGRTPRSGSLTPQMQYPPGVLPGCCEASYKAVLGVFWRGPNV